MYFFEEQLAYPTPITNKLKLGSLYTLDKPELMKDFSIVISIMHNPPKLLDAITHLSISLNDSKEENLTPHFKRVFALIDEGVALNKNVLIHCEKGMSRSASFVIAWLLREQHHQGLEADYDAVLLSLVKIRSLVSPNAGFATQLRHYSEQLNSELLVQQHGLK